MVSTPIGNLEDITVRAIEVLKGVSVIACEDTRKSRILLQKWNIPSKLMSLHRFTESRKSGIVLQRLEQGRDVALITDAGTPAVSDPGARLVRAAMDAGFQVTPIPGPSAVTAALSASGVQAPSFVYLGFVPRKDEQRQRFFKSILQEGRTAIFFETPKRVLDTLDIAGTILGSTRMVLLRELTKAHEEILAGTAATLRDSLASRETVRGEIIVVVEGAGEPQPDVDLERIVRELMEEGFSGKRLADEAKVRYAVKKGDAYARFLELKQKDVTEGS